MCFVLACNTKFNYDSKIEDILSHKSFIIYDVGMSNLFSKCRTHITSAFVVARVQYSTSVDDRATIIFFFVAHEIGVEPSRRSTLQ